jgi:phosphatidylglycerol lysyltransferase
MAHLGLRPWHSPSGLGSFAYADVAGARLTAGVPRAATRDLPALLAEFSTACRHAGLRRVHFGLPAAALEFLDPAAAQARWHVGDLPVFNLERWRSAHSRAGIPSTIRSQARRAARHGVTVRHLAAPPSATRTRDSLNACLHAWLRRKPLPPLRFLTTPFLFDPWPAEGVFLAEKDDAVVGFLTASRVLFGDTYRVDAVGRSPDAPNGCAELLVCEAFRDAALRGMQRATLGLAPLATRSGARASGWADRVSGAARVLGSPLYGFRGLESFKAKFKPDAWLPLYCVSTGPAFSPRDMLAVARAFAGGSLARYALRTGLWKLGFKA